MWLYCLPGSLPIILSVLICQVMWNQRRTRSHNRSDECKRRAQSKSKKHKYPRVSSRHMLGIEAIAVLTPIPWHRPSAQIALVRQVNRQLARERLSMQLQN